MLHVSRKRSRQGFDTNATIDRTVRTITKTSTYQPLLGMRRLRGSNQAFESDATLRSSAKLPDSNIQIHHQLNAQNYEALKLGYYAA